MNTTIKLIAVAAALALFAITAFAQSPAKECNDDTKATLYQKWYDNRKGDHQDVAYQAAKEYLTTCPADDSDQAKFLKKWVGLYEGASRKAQFEDAFNVKKNYSDAMNLGKQLLADDPNNVRINMLLGYIGYLASGNASLVTESADYAKKAIEAIESGKYPESWQPFSSKDEALAWLNYSLVKPKVEKGLADAAANAPNMQAFEEMLPTLLKMARYESALKKDPFTYYYIAAAYENGSYAKQSADYKAKYTVETPESKLALENINQVVDRMIDAYARSVALAGNDPKLQQNKTAWTQSVTDWYKFRHNKSDAGLNELIASILSKPLPDIPKPITSLPTPSPTPTTGAQTNPGTSTATGEATKPGASSASPQSPKANGTKTGSATKPKPRAYRFRHA